MNSLLRQPIEPVATINTNLNWAFSFTPVKVFTLLITSVYIGYTLQPVPSWLNEWFNISFLLKGTVLILAGWTSLYPLEGYTSIYVIIAAIAILGLFEGFRYIDTDKKKK